MVSRFPGQNNGSLSERDRFLAADPKKSGERSQNLKSRSQASQNGKSTSAFRAGKDVTAETRSGTLKPESVMGPPQFERMIIDGPRVGPETSSTISNQIIVDSSHGLINEVTTQTSNDPVLSKVDDRPKLVNQVEVIEVTRKTKTSDIRITPKKKTSKKWKRAVRGKEQQLVGLVSSPLHCMLEAGKVGRKSPKLTSLPQSFSKRIPGRENSRKVEFQAMVKDQLYRRSLNARPTESNDRPLLERTGAGKPLCVRNLAEGAQQIFPGFHFHFHFHFGDKVVRFQREIVRAFCFEQFWLKETDIEKVVEEAWLEKGSFRSSKDLRIKLDWCASRLSGWSRTRVLEREVEELLEYDEIYWKQRSRAEWLGAGDHNSKFFHMKASARKKKNQISYLLDNAGRPLSDAQSRSLSAPFLGKEIRVAIFSLSPTKAPDPDGFQPILPKILVHDWGVCLSILNGEISIRQFNFTNVVLIPKIKNPDNIRDFQPIALCGPVYKIISKVSSEDFSLFCMCAWAIWEDRNALLNNGKAKEPGRLVE
ncbi:hypothetical protein EZV62_015389 [Acer yangbiense]|uniref:Uncharacterized protein n=1 Tax=Acer yangbiense TaxID=1000413 RepID=A0A5C7HKK3_9ROSI|nr:hypothetical protein EZV62_015389 [Acer yangbiense]